MQTVKRAAVCLLFALAWLAAPAHAFDTAGFSKGLLWKIERSGMEPSYVFGTIHSEDERVLTLPPAAKAAFNRAGIFVMEAVLDQNAMMSMSARMMLGDGRTLKQILSGTLYARAVSATADYGMPEMAVQQMKPWAVAMVLSMPKPTTGAFLDLLLMQAATEQGKAVAGLESADEQLAIFDGMSMKDQITMLQDTLEFLPELDGIFARMHELYLAQDLGAISALSEELEMKGDRALGKRMMTQLVDTRNRRMAARVETYLKRGNAFIAVGALHLPGQKGVLNLLAKQGYRISAVF